MKKILLSSKNYSLLFSLLLIYSIDAYAIENKNLQVKFFTCSKGVFDKSQFLLNTFIVKKYSVVINPEINIAGKKFTPPSNNLEDCEIKDIKNWSCGGKIKSLNNRTYKDHTYRVINGKFTYEAGELMPLNEGCQSNTEWSQIN